MRFVIRALLLIIVAIPAAYADSDGYFCSGSGYLAVEFRAFNTKGLHGAHVLKIVRFGDLHGPRWTGEIVVEDFQTHTLVCNYQEITFSGMGDHGLGLLTYRVKVDAKGAPHIFSRSSDPQYAYVLKEWPPNIGNSARPGIIPLRADFSSHGFQLRLTEAPARRQGNMILHDKKTVLEEIDQSGRVVRSLILYTGTSLEST